MDNINIAYQTKREAQNACRHALTTYLFAQKEKPILFLYSGGSNREITTQVLDTVMHQKSAVQLTLTAVDERFDTDHSNYVELTKHVSEKQLLPFGIHIIDTSPFLNNQYEMADWYDIKIKEVINITKAQQGSIVTLLGMGEDGHIAGIHPYPDDKDVFDTQFIHTERFVVGYDATEKNEYSKRFTLTYAALEKSDFIFLFASGKKKYQVINESRRQELPVHQQPVNILYSLGVPYEVFLSRD